MITHSTTLHRLYLMSLMASALRQPDGQMLPMVVVCYLIETTDGKYILIDSGLPAGAQLPPEALPPENDKNVLEQITDLGLTPDDIDTVICTHFDRDHAGYHASFPKAEFIVQRQHYELAKGGHHRYATVRHQWDDPALRYRMVDGDTEIFPGLTLIETSGHVPGHQSVLVSLPETGSVLLVIDAVTQHYQFIGDRLAGPMDDNEDQLRVSTQKLLDLVEREKVSLVVFGHDGQQWQTLKTSPDYYA